MRTRSFDAFRRRAGLGLAVVAAYLLLLLGLAGFAQWQAHGRLHAETARRARLAARAVLQDPSSSVRDSLRAWASGAAPRQPAIPRDPARAHGISAIELHSPSGWTISAGPAPPDAEGSRLEEAQLRRLRAGETLVDDSGLGGPPSYAVLAAWQPVLGDDGGLLGVLRVAVDAEPLGLSRRQLAWSLLIQGGSTLAFVALLALFLRWALRPMALLQVASLEPGAPVDDLARADDTGFVIDTYRRVIDQLRDKEVELRRLRELERHRADELQELNASLIDSMLSGVVVLDMSGSIRSMNAEARRILQIPDTERVTGRAHGEILRGLSELESRLGACLRDGLAVTRDEIRLLLPGQGRRDLGISISPLRGVDGAQRGVLAILVDVTDVKRLHEAMRLKESMAELGELSAGVAHEFRNSLATILGFARLVGKRPDEEAREHAEAIARECQELRRVVDDFLRFANPTRLVLEPVDLGGLLPDLAEDARQRGGDKRVAFEVQAGAPVLTGDETLLRRTFTNLVRNACDAVGPGGRVRVSWEVRDREILLHVDDDGPGIPPADRERIFVPFFSRKEQGTGLGLAVARKVIVHHGGRIAAGDSPLGGARMTVTLPFKGT